MAEVKLYPAALTPAVNDEFDAETTRVLGTVFFSDVDTYIMALEWYAPLTLPAFADLGLWTLTGDDPASNAGSRTDLLTFNVGAMTGGAWNRLNLPTPRALPANTPRQVQVHTDGHYVFTNDVANTFPFTSDDGTLHAYSEEIGGNGRWTNGVDENNLASNQHPGSSGYNFFVGVITDVNGGSSPIDATLSITLPIPAVAMDVEAVAGATLALSLTTPQLTAESDVIASASLDLALPSLSASLSTEALAEATLNLTLPSPVASLELHPIAQAVLSILLPQLSGSFTVAEEVSAANLREYVWGLLKVDPVLNGLGINENSLFGSYAPDSPSADLQKWMVIRWGISEARLGRDSDVRRKFLSIWAYDRQRDFTDIDLMLERVRDILYPLKAINYNNSNGYITEVIDNGYSDDVWDPQYEASTKNWQLTIIASGL